MYARCVRKLGHNLPNAMHRWQKHTNSWEKGHFDAFNPVVKALEYRVTCFLEDSAFFYTNSTRVELHGSDVNKLRGTGAHCHIIMEVLPEVSSENLEPGMRGHADGS